MPKKLALLTHSNKQEVEKDKKLNRRLSRAANLVEMYFRKSPQMKGLTISTDLRDRIKINDKMNAQF